MGVSTGWSAQARGHKFGIQHIVSGSYAPLKSFAKHHKTDYPIINIDTYPKSIFVIFVYLRDFEFCVCVCVTMLVMELIYIIYLFRLGLVNSNIYVSCLFPHTGVRSRTSIDGKYRFV